MRPVELLKKIRDIGVKDDMPAEDAKYIRALNTGLFLAGLSHLMWSLQALGQVLHVPAATHLVLIILLLSNFILVHHRRYLFAKIFLFFLLNLHSVIAAVFFHGLYNDKWNILFAALIPLVFSKKETRFFHYRHTNIWMLR